MLGIIEILNFFPSDFGIFRYYDYLHLLLNWFRMMRTIDKWFRQLFDNNKITQVPTILWFQPLRTLLKILSCKRLGLSSITLALFLQLHHLREHAAHPADRATGAIHYERKSSARFDDTIHHGIGGRARTAGYRACHRVLFLPEETGAVSGGPGLDTQHPGAAGDWAGSQYGDLS